MVDACSKVQHILNSCTNKIMSLRLRTWQFGTRRETFLLRQTENRNADIHICIYMPKTFGLLNYFILIEYNTIHIMHSINSIIKIQAIYRVRLLSKNLPKIMWKNMVRPIVWAFKYLHFWVYKYPFLHFEILTCATVASFWNEIILAVILPIKSIWGN